VTSTGIKAYDEGTDLINKINVTEGGTNTEDADKVKVKAAL
jgi:hypothetical protein